MLVNAYYEAFKTTIANESRVYGRVGFEHPSSIHHQVHQHFKIHPAIQFFHLKVEK